MPLDNAGPFLTDPNGHEHHLPLQRATIGRAIECDVVIASKSVSREHTRVRREGRRWFVDDLGSTNGTYLNGSPDIFEPGILNPAETLKINVRLSPKVTENTTNLARLLNHAAVLQPPLKRV